MSPQLGDKVQFHGKTAVVTGTCPNPNAIRIWLPENLGPGREFWLIANPPLHVPPGRKLSGPLPSLSTQWEILRSGGSDPVWADDTRDRLDRLHNLQVVSANKHGLWRQ